MKNKIVTLRLGSVVSGGLGGPEAGALNLIYSKMLQDHGQTMYNHIAINQIGEDLNELIIKEPKGVVYINIRYSRTSDRKQVDQLNIIHEALLRLSDEDNQLDRNKLNAIYVSILNCDFKFSFICKEYVDKKRKRFAQLTVEPELKLFKYFLSINGEGTSCKLLVYSGGTDIFYVPAFFDKGEWNTKNEFVLTGKKNETEIRVNYEACSFEVINLTNYPKPPYFQMMRGDISQEEKQAALRDWDHSLPPGFGAIMSEKLN